MRARSVHSASPAPSATSRRNSSSSADPQRLSGVAGPRFQGAPSRAGRAGTSGTDDRQFFTCGTAWRATRDPSDGALVEPELRLFAKEILDDRLQRAHDLLARDIALVELQRESEVLLAWLVAEHVVTRPPLRRLRLSLLRDPSRVLACGPTTFVL